MQIAMVLQGAVSSRAFCDFGFLSPTIQFRIHGFGEKNLIKDSL